MAPYHSDFSLSLKDLILTRLLYNIESELVILLTGAKHKSEAEFDIHVNEARLVGISWDVIQVIPRGKLLSGMKKNYNNVKASKEEFSLKNVNEYVIPMLKKDHDNINEQISLGKIDKQFELQNNAKEREIAIVLFAAELLDTNTVSDKTYERTKQVLDGQDSVLVEITAIIGYYSYVAYTLNVFKIST